MRVYEPIKGLESVGTDVVSGAPDERGATADQLLVECDPIRSNHRRPVAPLPQANRDPTTFVQRIHILVNILMMFSAWGVSHA